MFSHGQLTPSKIETSKKRKLSTQNSENGKLFTSAFPSTLDSFDNVLRSIMLNRSFT